MLVRALAMLLVLILGGCSISGLLPDWTSADVAGPEPAYRFIIANGLTEIVGDPAKAGTFEISELRRVDSLKGRVMAGLHQGPEFPAAAALLCRLHPARAASSNSRLSVLIDQCEMQTYSPFDWIADANAPPVR